MPVVTMFLFSHTLFFQQRSKGVGGVWCEDLAFSKHVCACESEPHESPWFMSKSECECIIVGIHEFLELFLYICNGRESSTTALCALFSHS